MILLRHSLFCLFNRNLGKKILANFPANQVSSEVVHYIIRRFLRIARVSDRVKQNIGRLYFLIEGVLPQPNYPSAAVPFRVRNTKTDKWCYIVASASAATKVSTLPLTLCTNSYIPTTDYSKAPRGLRFPLGVLRIFTEQ